jgi:SH3-like domain-containing protein
MNRERRNTAKPSPGLSALAVVVLCAASGSVAAQAIEYRSAGPALIVRDAPSPQGRQLFRLHPGTPVEIVVSQDAWVRVREPGGSLNWVEQQALSNRRTVIVTAERATIRREARSNAPAAFEAQRNVVLELVAPPTQGWARVRHREGLEGYIHASEVWGL